MPVMPRHYDTIWYRYFHAQVSAAQPEITSIPMDPMRHMPLPRYPMNTPTNVPSPVSKLTTLRFVGMQRQAQRHIYGCHGPRRRYHKWHDS